MKVFGKFIGGHAVYENVLCPGCKAKGEYRVSLQQQPKVVCGNGCGQEFKLGFDSERQQPTIEDVALSVDRSGEVML